MKVLGKRSRRVEVSFSQERRKESPKFSRDFTFWVVENGNPRAC
jgi:hypothetical protein